MNKQSKKQLLSNLNFTSRHLYDSAQHYAIAHPFHNQQRVTQFDYYIFGHSDTMVQIIMKLIQRHNTTPEKVDNHMQQ